MKSIGTILIALSLSFVCSAQFSKNWAVTGTGNILQFKNRLQFNTYLTNFNFKLFGGDGNLMSSSNGDLKFVLDNYRVFFNDQGDTIENGSHVININTYNSIMFPKSDTSWQFINSFYLDSNSNNSGPFQQRKSWKNYYNYIGQPWHDFDKIPFGIYGTEVCQNKYNIIYFNNTKKNIRYSNIPYHLNFLNFVRTTNYNYAITATRLTSYPYTDTNRTFAIYTLNFKDNNLSIADSFLIRPNDYLPDSLKKIKNIGLYTSSGIQRAHITRNRDYALINFNLVVNQSSIRVFYRTMLFLVKLEPSSLRFISKPMIAFDFSGSDLSDIKGPSIKFQITYDASKSIFSPNDSLAFLNLQEDRYFNEKLTGSTTKFIAWKFRTEILPDAKSIYNIKHLNFVPNYINNSINPYGGLTIFYDSLDSYKFINFDQANQPFTTQRNVQIFKSSTLGSLSYPNFYSYDFIRAKNTVEYKDCGAYVKFKNNSDTSNGTSNFKWFVSKNTQWTEWDSFDTKEIPTIFYNKSGKYLFKVQGTSYKGSGYQEWYIDTIIIKIPPKPIVAFFAKDSIICRYTSLNFSNYCYSKDSISNIYVWSFGDGSTSNKKDPVHTYTKPGVYSISLFYRNGYCDSTLVKNQYIKVVDAPKPGFSVLIKQGCAPFNANFTDTSVLNVKQKEYYFSDTKLWQNVSINIPNFSHTFTKSGVYRTIQRLTGYTGCIIQTDSVIFNISKGLSQLDTLNISNSTVENKNALILWEKEDGAIKYRIFKNGMSYKETTDTFIYELTPYVEDAIYSVIGVDSCGNSSISGRKGKPIYLNGNIVNRNESSIIKFSPYFEWKSMDIIYKIQKWVEGSWITINSQKVNTPFRDNQFLNSNSLQACYRIEAYEKMKPSLLTHSNELCLPYIPTIFVPNAFSPNSDMINDSFDIICFGVTRYSMTVFNRWGQMIFKGKDMQAWDGQSVSEGVYMILINYTTDEGEELKQRVNVTLLK